MTEESLLSALSFRTMAMMAAFAIVSAVLGSALATSGGWRRAASRFPAPSVKPQDVEHFRFSSLRMTGGVLGVSTYNSCVTIGFSESGISLAVMPPFGLFHHPLHVPWAGIEECVKKPTAGSTILVLVNLRGGGGFEVTGRAASALDAWWESRGAGSISH